MSGNTTETTLQFMTYCVNQHQLTIDLSVGGDLEYDKMLTPTTSIRSINNKVSNRCLCTKFE